MKKESTIRNIINLTQSEKSEKDIYSDICIYAGKFIQFQSASLFVYDEENKSLSHEYQYGSDIVELVSQFKFDGGSGFSGWIIKQKKPVIVSSLTHVQIQRDTQFQSFASLPLWVGKKLFGVLNFGHSEKGKYSKNDMELLQSLSAEISLIFEQIYFRKKMEIANKHIESIESKLSISTRELTELKDSAAIGKIVIKIRNEMEKPLSSILGLAEILDLSIHTLSPSRIKETLKAIVIETKKINKILNKITDSPKQ
jgi:transcriptional regulator with GAF, ATPase, and Fis domain